MRLLPIMVFFIYVYIEISIFVAVANYIGVLLALMGIIATSIMGLSLVKSQGIKNLVLMQQKIASNQNPTNEVVKNMSLLLAGLLLLIPGFFTDILGALLLLSPVQHFFVKRLIPKFNIRGFQTRSSTENYAKTEIIEGDFKRKNDE